MSDAQADERKRFRPTLGAWHELERRYMLTRMELEDARVAKGAHGTDGGQGSPVVAPQPGGLGRSSISDDPVMAIAWVLTQFAALGILIWMSGDGRWPW